MLEIIIIVCLSIVFIILLRRLPEVQAEGIPEVQPAKSRIERMLEKLDDAKDSSANQDSLVQEQIAIKEDAEESLAKKDYTRAEEQYLKLATANPSDADNYAKLGIIYLESKNYPDAKEAFQAAVSHDSSNGFWYNNLGLAYFNLNKFSESVNAYKKAIKLGSDIPSRWVNLGLAYLELGKLNKALVAFKRACEMEPTNASYQRMLKDTTRKLAH